jgi:hypothetical protein
MMKHHLAIAPHTANDKTPGFQPGVFVLRFVKGADPSAP